MYDRVVIQDILKEIAQTQQVDLNAKQKFKGESSTSVKADSSKPHCVLVVIINEADSLTRDAQAALRRTMEKYMNNMRIILCASSTSKIIAPIKSRCLLVRVAAPTEDEVRLPLPCVQRDRQAKGIRFADAQGDEPRCEKGKAASAGRHGAWHHGGGKWQYAQGVVSL